TGLQEIFVQERDWFVIHPGDFVLGVTLEFIAIPNDMLAYVEGKSSLGRTGLLVVTASKVDPGFHGVVVLELANTGTVPLRVRPGMPIAQLVLHALDREVPEQYLYRGRYSCQIKPIP
ncbi:MAG TPA: dCTP deaminase, partial [Acidobacteriota bacterium]|nr:dCTP deaminase [Acidobacteriota bacterium]